MISDRRLGAARMMTAAADPWTMAVIVGLAGVTVLTRYFFFILDRHLVLGW